MREASQRTGCHTSCAYHPPGVWRPRCAHRRRRPRVSTIATKTRNDCRILRVASQLTRAPTCIVQTCNLTYCPTVTFVTIAAASRRGVAGPPPSRFPTPPSGTGLQPQVPTADDHGESARPPRRRHPEGAGQAHQRSLDERRRVRTASEERHREHDSLHAAPLSVARIAASLGSALSRKASTCSGRFHDGIVGRVGAHRRVDLSETPTSQTVGVRQSR